MSHYVVTIASHGRDDADTESRPRLVVHVEVVGGEAHVVEFSALAPAGTDLASGDLPMVDLKRIAQVFGRVADHPATAAPDTVTAPAAAPARGSSASPAAAPARYSSGSPSAAKARSPRRTRARTEAAGIGQARAYRKMPDPESLKQVYAEIGSIAGVAEHYGVPAHTAQGWIGRLRRLGVLSSGTE